MNLTTYFWLVQNEGPWLGLKANLKSNGFDLAENLKSDVGLIEKGVLLITDQPFPNAQFKSSDHYKILLVKSKQALQAINSLLDFDEILFLPDMNDFFFKQFSNSARLKIESKISQNKDKQLRIQNLKIAENKLAELQQEYQSLQFQVNEQSSNLNTELQKSHSLLKFILLLSKEMEFNKILNQLWKDLIQIRGTLNIYLIQSGENKQCRFYYKDQGMFIYKMIPLELASDEASFNSKEWANLISRIQNRTTANFFTFPLHKYFKNRLSNKRTMLLIEHQYHSEEKLNSESIKSTPEFESNSATIKFISERLPFISMAIEKSRMSDELITKNRLWENTFDGITDPLIIVDNQFNIVRSNQAFLADLKTTSSIKTCYASFVGLRNPCENCPLPKSIKKNEFNSSISFANEIYFNNKIYLVHSYPLSKSYSNKYFINQYSEVSKERALLVKTLHIEKMRSLDSFADQLSTNLRKPLLAIHQNLNANPILLESTDAIEIKKAVIRSEQILDNLTEFAKGNPNLSINTIDPLIERTLPFYKSLSRKHKIYMQLGATGFKAKVSPSLFQQVIFNLVNNACQAMTEPGSVTITSGPYLFNDLPGIRIEILDTGPGIPEQLRHNIFKSAFTTKEIKKGTGLGLKICQFIINSFQGIIDYQPMPKGSKFWIWIPDSTNDSI